VSALDALLIDFDQEMAATRELLARLPESALGWKPHDQSFSLGDLAAHLADVPCWGRQILETDGDELKVTTTAANETLTRATILAAFDRHVAAVRHDLLTRSDAELTAPWTLREHGRPLLILPRQAAMRRFLLHHVIHHRGQLSVYLRLQNVALPPLYGTTAEPRA
jgi:uncharacterized damage-inducible protein DinB